LRLGRESLLYGRGRFSLSDIMGRTKLFTEMRTKEGKKGKGIGQEPNTKRRHHHKVVINLPIPTTAAVTEGRFC